MREMTSRAVASAPLRGDVAQPQDAPPQPISLNPADDARATEVGNRSGRWRLQSRPDVAQQGAKISMSIGPRLQAVQHDQPFGMTHAEIGKELGFEIDRPDIGDAPADRAGS